MIDLYYEWYHNLQQIGTKRGARSSPDRLPLHPSKKRPCPVRQKAVYACMKSFMFSFFKDGGEFAVIP